MKLSAYTLKNISSDKVIVPDEAIWNYPKEFCNLAPVSCSVACLIILLTRPTGWVFLMEESLL